MSFFRRDEFKRNAKDPQGDGWYWAGLLLVLAVVVVTLQNCGG